jgi:hypothetical protein
VLALPAQASTPLTLTWSARPGWDGLYRYTFRLTLDNHDNSWQAGQGFGWIIFGDGGSAGPSTINDFEADNGVFPVGPWTSVTRTAGQRNGPTLSFGRNTWTPSAVGDYITWTGTSSSLVASGNMKWTALVVKGGAKPVDLEPATKVTPCLADMNGDGFTDGIDYDFFNMAFEAGSAAADVNGDGFTDGIDYDTFNRVFEQGC